MASRSKWPAMISSKRFSFLASKALFGCPARSWFNYWLNATQPFDWWRKRKMFISDEVLSCVDFYLLAVFVLRNERTESSLMFWFHTPFGFSWGFSNDCGFQSITSRLVFNGVNSLRKVQPSNARSLLKLWKYQLAILPNFVTKSKCGDGVPWHFITDNLLSW